MLHCHLIFPYDAKLSDHYWESRTPTHESDRNSGGIHEPFRLSKRCVNMAAQDNLHIGLVLPSLEGGGAERVVLTLAKSLIERGHTVDLVMERIAGQYRKHIPKGLRLYHPSLWNADRELLRYWRSSGVHMQASIINPIGALWSWFALDRKRLGVRVRRRYALYAYSIARYIRKARPNLLLSALPNGNAPAVYAVELTNHSVPLVVSVHNNMSRSYVGDRLHTARALYPRADAVVAVSRGLRDNVQESLGIEPEAVHAIYNPISASDIRQMAQEPSPHPWLMDGEPPVILNVGREAAAKDYLTLVRAFGITRRRIRSRMLIMGSFSESYRNELISEARRSGAAEDLGFADFDENPFRYMCRASLFALSSHWEGLPTVLIEALACGKPVVSTDTPYGPREILEEGKWGKLAPIGDSSTMAQAMIETLQGDHPPEEALLRRADDFSPEQAANAYLGLFQKVIG